jgi:hypothetical protein
MWWCSCSGLEYLLQGHGPVFTMRALQGVFSSELFKELIPGHVGDGFKGCLAEQFSGFLHVCFSISGGQDAIVSDFVKAFWEDASANAQHKYVARTA